MKSTLKMLLPTTLPIAMSVWPSSTAPTDTAISGALVPKATTVSPTTSGEMPKDSASREAPRTSRSAPTTSAARPAMKSRRFMVGADSSGKTARRRGHGRPGVKGPVQPAVLRAGRRMPALAAQGASRSRTQASPSRR